MTTPLLTQACWTPDSLRDVLDLRAAYVTDATFLATHHPALLRRRESDKEERGITYSESEFRDEFFEASSANLLVAVIGSSGSGKSHLVRWLRTQVPVDDHLHVVYVPKRQTNLRAVLQLILHGLHSSEFDQFREDLTKATQDLTLAQAMMKFRQALAFKIKSIPDDVGLQFPDGTPLTVFDYREHREFLPFFLSEKVVVERLDAQGGMIHRLMSEALEGRTDDKTEAFAITEADLPLDELDITRAGLSIQEYHGDLVTNPQYIQGALAILNYYRDSALREVYNLGGTELLEIMRRVRELLKQAGKTLILLIEDFALLQGIQQPLLEALIEDETRDLCAIRVALAVTTGYYRQLPETVRTRLSFLVDLDVTYSDKKGRELREQLAGRYLNAVRWGEAQLNDQMLPLTPELKSKCLHCSLIDKCHKAFGRVRIQEVDGPVGLFPFNTHALEVVNRHHQERDDNLNPRELIRGLSLTLREAQDGLPNGTFPTKRFRDTYNTDAPQLTSVEDNKLEQVVSDQVLLEQSKFVTRVWGGSPAAVHSFKVGVQEAFRYPAIDGSLPPGDDDDPPRPDPEPEPQPKPGPHPPPPLSPLAQALQEWSNNLALSQNRATDLRNVVAKLINERIDFESMTVYAKAVSDSGTWGTQRNIEFEGQTNATPGNAVRLRLPLPGQTRSQVARALTAYMHYEKEGSWPPDLPDAPWQFEEVLTAWVDEVTPLMDARADQAEALAAAATGLLWIATSQGRITSSTVTQDWLALMVQPPAPPSPATPAKWAKVVSDLGSKHNSLHQRLLTYAAVRKGTGRAVMLDAALVLKPLKRRRPRLSEALGGKEAATTSEMAQLLSTVDDAIKEVVEQAKAIQANIQQFLPEDQELSQLPSLVREAFTAADQAGISPFRNTGRGTPAEQLKTLITTLTNLPILNVLKQCEHLMADDIEPETLMSRASRFPWAEARRIQTVLDETHNLLADSLVRGHSQTNVAKLSGTGASLASTLRDNLMLALNDLEALQQPVKEQA